MIRPEQIPGEVVEAGAQIISICDEDTPFGDIAIGAFLAMLRAWPGATNSTHISFNGSVRETIILPLQQDQQGEPKIDVAEYDKSRWD